MQPAAFHICTESSCVILCWQILIRFCFFFFIFSFLLPTLFLTSFSICFCFCFCCIQLGRLKKAHTYAQELKVLVGSDGILCDERTELEVTAYAAWMEATLRLELQSWYVVISSHSRLRTRRPFGCWVSRLVVCSQSFSLQPLFPF